MFCLPCLELLGAQRVGDVLEAVTQAVSKVIGGVDTPCVPCPENKTIREMLTGLVRDVIGKGYHL